MVIDMDEKIKVSIVCNTYNHEKYIRQTLEGFVKQKTSFKFEVLIHDDASTDKTAEIIREFEHEYPEIVRPIYQKENQYSKGVKISSQIQYPRAKGEFLAVCEGDDFWCDNNKLQRQYDAMINHPEVDMCAHRAETVYGPNDVHRGYQGPDSRDRLLTVDEVIVNEGGYLPTNSLFFRKDIVCVKDALSPHINLDYMLQVRGALRGGIFYFGKVMSVYRICTPGSWTSRTQKNGVRKRAVNKRIKKFLITLNKETKFKYFGSILRVYVKATARDMYCLWLSLRSKRINEDN